MTEAEWLTSASELDMLRHLNVSASARKLLLWGCARFRPFCSSDVEQAVLAVIERMADGESSAEDQAFVRKRGGLMGSLIKLGVAIAHDRLEFSMLAAGDGPTQDPKPGPERPACQLLRDIFGNPFQRVTFDSAWRSPPVAAVAHAIYAERRFDELPILADALEEAGCTAAPVLEHCRGGGRHVRGCWVVDLALAKT